MRNASAPVGYYTDVEIILRLKNRTTKIYRWQTPMALARALHKAPAWAKQEMRKARIRGRSQIVGINIEAQLKPRAFKRG